MTALTRNQHKASRVRELRQLDYDGLMRVRLLAKKAIKDLSGQQMPIEEFGAAAEPHRLTVDCIDEIIREATLYPG